MLESKGLFIDILNVSDNQEGAVILGGAAISHFPNSHVEQ
jgi:hypothetical protein